MGAVVSFTPRGRDSFVGGVEGASGLSLTVTGSLTDLNPVLFGSPALKRNEAVVTNLWAYAKHEAFRRRLRSPEKRQSHLQQAETHRQTTEGIVDMMARLGEERRSGWCSACFNRTQHRRVDGSWGTVRTYLCGACGSPTTPCAGPRCPHLANRGTGRVSSRRFCAEHRHDVPGFDKLQQTVSAIDDWAEWLTFNSRNLSRGSKLLTLGLASAVVVAPAAFLAAPAIGGIIGAYTGLTGAAATSHGLALLGGGAVASGGWGMAGGTAVVTAVGSALGGASGAAATAAYVRADKSFRVQKLRSGTGAPVLLASGFLTEGDEGWGEWERLVVDRYPERPVYRVHWGAKELAAFGALAALGGGKGAAAHFAKQVAGKAGRRAAGKLSWLGALFAAGDLVANPWMVARTRAEMTGVVLADLIARTEEPQVVLIGHSLGARVMVSAAKALGTRPGQPKVAEIHLLGAAVGNKGDWRTLNDSVTVGVWNYWSSRDLVLKHLYVIGQAGQRAAGQTGFRTKFPRVKDRNVSRMVDAHSAYFSRVELVHS